MDLLKYKLMFNNQNRYYQMFKRSLKILKLNTITLNFKYNEH